MARVKKSAQNTAKKLPDSAEDVAFQNVILSFQELSELSRTRALGQLGVGGADGKYYTCARCGKIGTKTDFYRSCIPGYKPEISGICKSCIADIAMPTLDGKQKATLSVQTMNQALSAANKPFLNGLWQKALDEACMNPSRRTAAFSSYMKNLSSEKYKMMSYLDSDMGSVQPVQDNEDEELASQDVEAIEQFEKNKRDTMRLLGYLPFEKEKLSDQPFLYSQLIGFLDASEEGNDDMMRTSSIISIVRGFLQQSQIDDMIAQYIQNPVSPEQNVATIKSLQAMKRDITTSITALAKESCISLKNSRQASKGENTWTGKVKRIKDLNLREGEVNGFDIGTCRGMQQVLDMSNASILRQLRLDESDYTDIIAEQRELVVKTRREKDLYAEVVRVLLRENMDLRDTLAENGLLSEDNLHDLEDLFSPFSELSDGTNEDGDTDE